MEDRIAELLAPIAEELGLDVLKVSLGGSHQHRMLKVVVDKAGGVPFDSITRISRGLSLQLDAEDLIDGHYRLEITSPGLDWPLTSEADFIRHAGELLKVSFTDDTSLIGENLGPCEHGVRLGLEKGGERLVSMDEVVRIVRTVNWKRINEGGKTDGFKDDDEKGEDVIA